VRLSQHGGLNQTRQRWLILQGDKIGNRNGALGDRHWLSRAFPTEFTRAGSNSGPRVSSVHSSSPSRRCRRCAEGRHQGEARSHDLARRVQEGTRPPGRSRPSRRPGSHGRAKGEAQPPGRHDDRSAARRPHGGRDRADRRVLQLRHERPHADRVGHEPRRLRQLPAAVCGIGDLQDQPVCLD